MHAHIEKLVGWGLSRASIAEAAGVSDVFVRQHAAGRSAAVLREYAQAVLAVGYRPHPRQTMVLAVGCLRRVDALMAIGHALTWQAQQVGIGTAADLRTKVSQPVIHHTYQRAIFALYADHNNRAGPSKRAITWARKAGRPGPFAWDDDTIDDPDATPVPYERGGAAAADPEDIRFLMSPLGGSLTTKEIAERLGLEVDDVKAAQCLGARLTATARVRKLSDAQVAEIRARVADGEHPRDVAKLYGTSKSNVYNIIAGRARAVPLAPPSRWAGSSATDTRRRPCPGPPI
jgi:hypothetical protein